MKKSFVFLFSIGMLAFTACSDDDANSYVAPPLASAALQPATGGPSQANSVYVDLSAGNTASSARTSWDLGFYSGSDFRVVLNSSLKMSAKQLESTNIDAVVASDDTMLIAQGQGNANQVDDPTSTLR